MDPETVVGTDDEAYNEEDDDDEEDEEDEEVQPLTKHCETNHDPGLQARRLLDIVEEVRLTRLTGIMFSCMMMNHFLYPLSFKFRSSVFR